MKKILTTIFFCLIFFGKVTFIAEAIDLDSNEGRFKNIGIDMGLSQGTILSIIQDNRGYMWFGSNDGLNRYNGYDFDIIRGSENTENTIYTGLIRALESGSDDEIWVGTSSGLSRINSYTLKVERFKSSEFDKKAVSNPNIKAIFRDSDGIMWIGTERGLNRYSKETGEFYKYFSDNVKEDTLSNSSITGILEISKEKLLVGTEEGLNIFNKNTGKVKRLDKDKNIITMYKGLKGDIFFSSVDGGIGKYNIEKSEIDKLEKENKLLGEPRVNTIIEDLDGNLIVGTTEGLIKIEEEKAMKYKNKYYDKETITNDNIQNMYRDKKGLIWIGTYNGISIFNGKTPFKNYKRNQENKNSLSGESILGMYEDLDGSLWIGTAGKGLNHYNRIEQKFTHIEKGENGLSDNVIFALEGNERYIWIGTKKGLDLLDKKTKKIERDIMGLGEISSLYLKDNRYLFVGGKEGLGVLDIKEKKYKNLNKTLKKANVGEVFVRVIFEDSKDNIWIGMGWNGGLLRIDAKNNEVKLFKNNPNDINTISNNAIKGINEDLNGDIWISTSEGINKLEKDTDNISRYNTKDGLINNYTYGILVDEKNNIWISSNGGISKLDRSTETFSNYTYIDGIQGNEFNGNAQLKTGDGEMFFGGVNGISAFYPEEISMLNMESKVALGNFEVFNREEKINWKEIILEHNENTISIDYFMPEYVRIGKWNYEYMLEGFDKEWNSSDGRNYVRYTNLAPGRYKFKVRARFGIDKTSKETSIEFFIKKPWYRTGIAYTIYGGIIITIIILTINRVEILKRLVRERTEKLNKELIEKEELYKELLRFEKLRNTYLVNLSHELRTPLNVILSSEQLIRRLNETNKINRDNLDKYMKIIQKNSKSLLKVINDLIDSSKINSGVYKLEYEKTNIVYLVEEVALSMSEYIESNGLELIIDPEIEEKEIECSVIDIERCIINLISNAIKFTEKGKIYIGIKDFDTYVEIIIEDSGVGISKEHQSMIFDRFATLETGISSKHCSSGIGLTLVKNLVELHKGEINLVSEVGVGSTFTIKLPSKK